MTAKVLFRAASVVLIVSSSMSFAGDTKGVWTMSIENDLFGQGGDKHYTHGTEVSYVSDTYNPDWLLSIARAAPFYSPQRDVRYGLSVGQAMFTPDNISEPELIENDRPYAGWLYSTFSLMNDYRIGNNVGEQRKYNDVLELTIGIVGPSSQADHAQRWVHKKVDSDEPRGWNNQLHDELGINIAYMRQWQYSLIARHLDITTRAGAMLGNVYTHAETGLMVRLGNQLGLDYGPPLMRPSNIGSKYFKPKASIEWYVFAGASGRLVGRNIFLDGNTSKDSHSVNKNRWVGDLQAGIVVNIDRAQFAYTYIDRSREFEGQKEGDAFGSLAFSYRF